MNYRVYLFGPNGGIQAAEFFEASDDVMAKEIAAGLYGSCCDVFVDYELWHGARSIVLKGFDRQVPVNIEDIIQARQNTIVDLEDRLQQTFQVVAESKKLLEISAQLRQSKRPVINRERVNPRALLQEP